MPQRISDELVALATFLCWGTIYGYKEVAQRASKRRERAAKGARVCPPHNDVGPGVYGQVFQRRAPDAPCQPGLAGLIATPAPADDGVLFQPRHASGPLLGLKELAAARRLPPAVVASNTHMALGLLSVMYGCTQQPAGGRRERKRSSGGGGSDGGNGAAVWSPGPVSRHRRGDSLGLGLGALALSGCGLGGGSSSCATLDTLARCSLSDDSSAASTGNGVGTGGPGSEGTGVEPCSVSVGGCSYSGGEDRGQEEQEDAEEQEAWVQTRQLAEVRALASSLFALMTTNLMFSSCEAEGADLDQVGREQDEEEEEEAAVGLRSFSTSPYSVAAAVVGSSATSPGAVCSPWAAAAAAGEGGAASCPMASRGFDRLRVRSNTFYGGDCVGSDSEDGDGEGAEDGCNHAQEATGSCPYRADTASGVGRRPSQGRCQGVYLPAWSSPGLSQHLAAAAASESSASPAAAPAKVQTEVGAADEAEDEQLQLNTAGLLASEPEQGALACPVQRLAVLLPALEALEPVLEAPQELEENGPAARGGHAAAEQVAISPAFPPSSPCGRVPVPSPGPDGESAAAACDQHQLHTEAAEGHPAITAGACSAVAGKPQVVTAGTAADEHPAAAVSSDAAWGSSTIAASEGRLSQQVRPQLHTPPSASRSRPSAGCVSTGAPVVSPSPTARLHASRSARTQRSTGPASNPSPALVGAALSPGPSPLTSPMGLQQHGPGKPSTAAARPAAATPGSSAVPVLQLRRQSSTGSSCSTFSCSSTSAGAIASGATPRTQRHVPGVTAAAAAAEASLTLSRRRQSREQQSAQAAALGSPPSAGSPGPGPGPSYLRSTAASAARAAVGMTPRAAAVHHHSATAVRQ